MVEQPLSNALRIIFLIVTGTVHHFATTVPHEARKEESEKGGKGPIAQNVTQHDLHPSAVRPFLLLLEISKYSLWTLTILEGVCRLLQMFPESKASNFLLPRLLSTTSLYLKSDSQFFLLHCVVINHNRLVYQKSMFCCFRSPFHFHPHYVRQAYTCNDRAVWNRPPSWVCWNSFDSAWRNLPDPVPG